MYKEKSSNVNEKGTAHLTTNVRASESSQRKSRQKTFNHADMDERDLQIKKIFAQDRES